MDRELYVALTEDDIDIVLKGENWLRIRDQMTPTNNTVLHVACQHGSIACVKEILSADESESLLLQTNSRGETALHLAARQGHFETVEALVSKAKSLDQQSNDLENQTTALQNLIRASNVEFETALHAAVRYNHENVVGLLVKEDPRYSYPQNKSDETPLYLAAARGYAGVTKIILDNCESPTFGGPHGRTALHGALMSSRGNGTQHHTGKRRKETGEEEGKERKPAGQGGEQRRRKNRGGEIEEKKAAAGNGLRPRRWTRGHGERCAQP